MVSTTSTAARTTRTAGEPPSLREWIRDHDEKWLFVVLYLGLAVILSVLVSLFWLVVVASLHYLLETIRQAHYRDGRANVMLHALWEVKLDFGLVLLALTLVLYMDAVLGLLGIQSAARAAAVTRAGVRVGSRAAAWERTIRGFLVTVDEIVRVAYAAVVLRRRARKPASSAAESAPSGKERTEVLREAAPAEPADPVPSPEPVDRRPAWRRRWGMADRIGVALVACGVGLILVAPFVTPHDWMSALETLRDQLRPFPNS